MANQKILILGAGQQGSTIAEELLKISNRNVTVADIRPKSIKSGKKNANYQYFDAKDTHKYKAVFSNYFKSFDLIIGALPAEHAHLCVEIVANIPEAKYVDLSFTAEDLYAKYNKIANKNKSLILADCGLAPGLSNLIIGRLLTKHPKNLKDVSVYVGGVARFQTRNKFGYTCTWSLDDLCSEYTREARIINNGKTLVLPPPVLQKENLELLNIPNIGIMEAFPSDGVRSLLRLKKQIPNMVEKTLRWPGHLKEVQKLIKPMEKTEGLFFIEPFMKAFKKLKPGTDDLVVMVIDGAGERYLLIDYGNTKKSAMTRTTAFSCASFAELVLSGQLDGMHGIVYPEQLGQNNLVYEYIENKLSAYGIIIKQCEQ